ncbi:MAG: hypothetical protein ACKOA9_11980 [Actinomycetota bacterium]
MTIEPTPERSSRKRLGAAALALLGVVALTGVGTFATFNAQTKNPGNLFSDGTLVLSNTKDGGTACLSTGGGTTDVNSNDTCDQLMNLTVRKPGDSSTTKLTIKNEGSLAASALKVFSAACTNADASGETYHGTGNPCSQIQLYLQLYLQQYTDSSFSTPSACLYGGATVANTCDFSDATKTLAAFQSAYGSAAGGLGIGSGLTTGASRYVKVGIMLPSASNNSFQGRQATFDLTWYAEQ